MATIKRSELLARLGHPSEEWRAEYERLTPGFALSLGYDSIEEDIGARPRVAAAGKLPGVGLPIPENLPPGWTAQWCNQLRLQGPWEGHPDAVKAGFPWQAVCPRNGWQGWFAEFFPRTAQALRAGWETNAWGTKNSHDGNFTLLEFWVAEVFWTKSHPLYRLAEGYPWDFSGGEEPPVSTHIPPGLPVQVLVAGSWINDAVKRRSGQGITFQATKGNFRVADEGKTWRRRAAAPEPPPPPPPPPPPKPPTLPPLAPAETRIEELRALAIRFLEDPETAPLFARLGLVGDLILSGVAEEAWKALNDDAQWKSLRPHALDALRLFRRARKALGQDQRELR